MRMTGVGAEGKGQESRLKIASPDKMIIVSISVFSLLFLLAFVYGSIVVNTPAPATSAVALKSTSSPSISSSLSTANLSISGYVPNSTVSTVTTTATTTTDAPTGYNIRLNAQDSNTCLRHASLISSGINCGDSASANKKLEAGNLVGDNQWSLSSNGGTTWILPQDNSGTSVFHNLVNGPYINDKRTITMGMRANLMAASGAYQGTLVVTVAANYIPEPIIANVYDEGTTTNATGPISGGTLIDIIGTDLDTAYQVFIDLNGNGAQDSGEECLSTDIVNSTKIACNTPAHSTAQARNVVVKTWGGTATKTNGFTYYVPAVGISSVSPNSGHFRGGDTITITGYDFAGATAVRIGASNVAGNDCKSFTVVSSTKITCIAPSVISTALSGANNTMNVATKVANVYVTTRTGSVLTSSSAFTHRYLNKSTTTAGSYMDILGTDIVLGSKIYVDGVECTNKKITGSTTAACNTPIETTGAKTVTIEAPVSVGNMQNWTGCSAIPTPNYATENWWKDPQYTKILTDTRNSQKYRVRRMPDGKCWMIDNLKLKGYTLTSANSDVTSSFTIPANPVQDEASHGNGTCVGGSVTAGGGYLTCDGTNAQSVANNKYIAYSDPSIISSWGANSCMNQDGVSSDSLTGCGYLYNLYTATAGTGGYDLSESDAVSSICPAGWKLPTGRSSGQAAALNNAMLTGHTTPSTVSDERTHFNWSYMGPFESAASGGYYTSTSLSGASAGYWSSSVGWLGDWGDVYGSGVSQSVIFSSAERNRGLAVRCVR